MNKRPPHFHLALDTTNYAGSLVCDCFEHKNIQFLMCRDNLSKFFAITVIRMCKSNQWRGNEAISKQINHSRYVTKNELLLKTNKHKGS